MKSEPGPLMTLGNAAAARVRLIVWCQECRHQVEPDPAEQAQRYGPEVTVLDWRERPVCSKCGSRHVDMLVTGRSGAESREPPAPPLVNRSAGVVTPMIPSRSLYPGGGYGEMKPDRVRAASERKLSVRSDP
jgi:hypothetical protein